MKKALAFLVAAALCLTGVPSAFAGPATAFYQQFTDISQPAWGAGIMQRMIQTGIVQGYQGTGAQSTTYYAHPTQPVTREEFAVLLARSLNVPDSGTAPPMADWSSVPTWAQGAVAALVARQVVQGEPGADGRTYFAGEAYITRAELTAMLERATDPGGTTTSSASDTSSPSGTVTPAGTTTSSASDTSSPSGTATPAGTTASGGTATSSSATATSPFQDVNPGDWYYSYVLAAYQAGIVQGEAPGRFDPQAQATRVEVMAMLWRLLTGDEAAVPSDPVLVSTVQTVNNLVAGVLGGQNNSELAPYLTGEAALGLASGNFFLLEDSAPAGVSQVQVNYPAGPPRVVAKSSYLATVASTVNVTLSLTGQTTAPTSYQVVEYYRLINSGGGWLIYAVDTASLSVNGGVPSVVDTSVGNGF